MVCDVKLVVDNELVEIDVYQLNSVVRTLFDIWKWDLRMNHLRVGPILRIFLGAFHSPIIERGQYK